MTADRRLRAPGPLLTARSRQPAVVRHRVSTPLWTAGPLRIALMSDFHTSAPWTTLADLAAAAETAMSQSPDLVVLCGDFLPDPKVPGRRATASETVSVLAEMAPPAGVFAVLGNHDWKDCRLARRSGNATNSVIEALAASPITLLRNASAPLSGTGAWIAGFDSQRPWRRRPGFHDPDAAFAAIPPGSPTILAAHEPDWFAEGDARAVLQLSGHTHGGQANLAGWRPLTPSKYGGRYAWGHHRNGDRHLVVSGGIGFTGLPLRFAAPPEITIVDLLQET